MAAVPQKDGPSLHKLCRDGDVEKIRALFDAVDGNTLVELLGIRKGILGFTPLHDAVASGNAKVLDYLLTRTGNVHVNAQSNSNYTPLHLAASAGQVECVLTLLKHSADIAITDEWGKTPKQAAELNARYTIVHLLKIEGLCICNSTIKLRLAI